MRGGVEGGKGREVRGGGNRSSTRSTIHSVVRSDFLCLCLSIPISPYGFGKTKLNHLPPIEALNLLASLPRDLIEPELRVGSRRLIKTRTAHLPPITSPSPDQFNPMGTP